MLHALFSSYGDVKRIWLSRVYGNIILTYSLRIHHYNYIMEDDILSYRKWCIFKGQFTGDNEGFSAPFNNMIS